MAIDPRIALMGQSMDIGKSFRLGMDAAKTREELLMAPLQREAQQLANDSVMEELKNAPIKNQILQSKLDAQNAAAAADAYEVSEIRRKAALRSVAQGSRHLIDLVENKKDFKGALDFLYRRKEDLIEQGIEDTEETDAAIEALESGDAEKILGMVNDAQFAVDSANDEGLLDSADSDEKFSATTTTLPDGTTIQTTNQGRKIVTNAEGKVLKGKAATEAIKEAARFGIEEQGRRAGARVTAQEQAKQRQIFVKQGLNARGLMKDTKRLLELNELITTGKTAAARKAFGDLFGVTDPNLGEFNSKAGQLVLGQIRQLGANPTEGERAFLEQITPSIEQGGAVNKALLEDMLELQQRQVDRAKWLAKNPDRTVEDYLLETDTDDFEGSSSVQVQGSDIQTMSDDDLLSF